MTFGVSAEQPLLLFVTAALTIFALEIFKGPRLSFRVQLANTDCDFRPVPVSKTTVVSDFSI